MKFKSDKQRKAVMARIQNARWQSMIRDPKKIPVKKSVIYKGKSYTIGDRFRGQLKIMRAGEKPKWVHHTELKKPRGKDTDNDGVPDYQDCKPKDPKKQGLIHDAIAGVGKVGGYVGAEVTSGAKDMKTSARAEYKRRYELDRLKAQRRATEREKQALELQKQRRAFRGEEVALHQQRVAREKTPISVPKTKTRWKKTQKKVKSDGWDDGTGSVFD